MKKTRRAPSGRALKWKPYDDRALALALAYQTKPIGQIAREFGLTRQYVYCIRSGRQRPELQPMIQSFRQAMVERSEEWALDQTWALMMRHVRTGLKGKGATARKCREFLLDRFLVHPPRKETVAATRSILSLKKPYNQDAMVHRLAEGDLTLAQIAAECGLSKSYLCEIRQGKKRADLQPRIQSLRRLIEMEARRVVVPRLGALMAEQIREGVHGRGENARECREYLMVRFLLPAKGCARYGQETVAERRTDRGH